MKIIRSLYFPRFARFMSSYQTRKWKTAKQLTCLFNRYCNLFAHRKFTTVTSFLRELEAAGYVKKQYGNPVRGSRPQGYYKWKNTKIKPKFSDTIFFSVKEIRQQKSNSR